MARPDSITSLTILLPLNTPGRQGVNLRRERLLDEGILIDRLVASPPIMLQDFRPDCRWTRVRVRRQPCITAWECHLCNSFPPLWASVPTAEWVVPAGPSVKHQTYLSVT